LLFKFCKDLHSVFYISFVVTKKGPLLARPAHLQALRLETAPTTPRLGEEEGG
jgi:hypothetical protein